MINIRKNVFETNSSSTHSIAISDYASGDYWTKSEAISQLKELGAEITSSWDSNLDLTRVPKEYWSFGRSYEAYNDFAIKLIYALVSYSYDDIITRGIIDFVKSYLNVSEIILPFKYDSWSHGKAQLIGDIDHDSVFNLSSKINRNLSMEKFLTSKDIYLIIDNEG